ncbi:hypothetical protein [Mangrovibacterium sp.]|uniref:hypothetical protein n=1 Tax=Mangrovibacterium sp. TaxID=1961364 RepID=UPI0035688870
MSRNNGTYNRRYYLHRRIKLAGFSIHYGDTERTILVREQQIRKAQTNKYVAELQREFNYGIQLLNPMMEQANS